MTDEAEARSRRSFDRAQTSHENNMGEDSGTEDFVCPYCGENYELHWQKEAGASWFEDEEICPHCGWPAPTDSNQAYNCYGEDNDTDTEAPCPVCGELAHSIGYTGKMDEIEKLSCGHWIASGWHEYAETYGDLKIGLHKIGEFDNFVREHPKAGETAESFLKEQLRTWYIETIGYDIFKDDPKITIEEVAKIKEEYLKEEK